MSDAKLWIDEGNYTATITEANVSYTMPLWVFEDMHDIIMAEAEKKVEVTHRDFDVQQGLLDRYKAENAKLRELTYGLIDGYECGRGRLCEGCTWDGMSDPREFNCKVRAEAREMGVTADD